MISLETNDIGFDKTKLAFPSLKTCMAIVYQVNGGLFGWHDGFANQDIFNKRCANFRMFVQNNALNHFMFGENLFGLTNHMERYNDDQQGNKAWANDLLSVAKYLEFKGPIWGIRLKSNIVRQIATMDSAYAEFKYDSTQNKQRPVVVRYRTWSDMEPKTIPLPPMPVGIYGHFNTKTAGFKKTVEVGMPLNVPYPHTLKNGEGGGGLHIVGNDEFTKIR